MIDHCISYFYKKQQEKIRDVYVTDVLRMIAENVAKLSGGSYIKIRYLDLIKPKKEETRTADEIVNGIREKLKGS